MKRRRLHWAILVFCLGTGIVCSADVSSNDPDISLTNPKVQLVITPIENQDGATQSYGLQARPNQQIWMSLVTRGESSSVRTPVILKDGKALLKTQVTAVGDRSLIFTVDLENSGLHYNLEYQKTFPGLVAFRVFQPSFNPVMCIPTFTKEAWLDYFAPYDKHLQAGHITSFDSTAWGPASLRIDKKKYENNAYAGVQVRLELDDNVLTAQRQ